MTNDKLKKVKMNGNIEMSLYDINKQIMFQMPELNNQKIEIAKNLIEEYSNTFNATYYMLLCNEYKYYTIFNCENQREETLKDIVFECLNNIGQVISVDATEDDAAIEIWVKLEEDAKVFYLFAYDKGVVELA